MNSRIVHPVCLLASLVTCAVACVGTNTGNPLTSDISGCKSESDFASKALTGTERYDGLSCMHWERTEDSLHLEALNFRGGCSITWQGTFEPISSGPSVLLTNPSCAVAACGSCLYDATFDIDLRETSIADDASLPLRSDASCSGDADLIDFWSLRSNASEGITCDYAQGLDWHAGRLGTCGQTNMPCRRDDGLCADDGQGPCDAGLTCTEVSTSNFVCLEQCTTDDDCAAPDVMSCNDGLCQLDAP